MPVVRLDDGCRGRLVDRHRLELASRLRLVAERVEDLAPREVCEVFGHRALGLVRVQLVEPHLRFAAKPLRQAPLLAGGVRHAAAPRASAAEARSPRSPRRAACLPVPRSTRRRTNSSRSRCTSVEREHRAPPARWRGLAREATAREELLFDERIGVVDRVHQRRHRPACGDLAVQRQRVDVEARVPRARRDQAIDERRRVLAVPRRLGELLGSPGDRGPGRRTRSARGRGRRGRSRRPHRRDSCR